MSESITDDEVQTILELRELSDSERNVVRRFMTMCLMPSNVTEMAEKRREAEWQTAERQWLLQLPQRSPRRTRRKARVIAFHR